MKLTTIGCYSATPRISAHTTSQVLESRGHTFLIDCGEGTQMELRKHKVKFNQIKHIFISHLHGDHCFGLIGLISTFRLLNREADLHVYGPNGIKELIMLQMKLSKSWINFNLIFHELTSLESELIFEDYKIEVHTIPLDHRLYTNGFLFKEKAFDRKLLVDKAEAKHIDVAYYRKLKQGADVLNSHGELISNADVTTEGIPSKSYAFCSDTAYFEAIIPIINNVDVLYHEATFLETHANLCAKTKHSTAKQAAEIAKKATVGKLILGHYSSRYNNLEDFKTEAQTVFSCVELAEDGKTFQI
ncbi:MAG: ribonuclease Z [Bacteroidetes bacterium]|nr:ribonuclease Z [Bacteroidota bacterium]MDA0859586.1 ribonuclease Z [Bacteroidota bacterium]MDA1317828.1 ribonuclease Z [Bacteroidota bacterium]